MKVTGAVDVGSQNDDAISSQGMAHAQALFLDLDATLLDGRGNAAGIRATCRMLEQSVPGLTAERLITANLKEFVGGYWPDVENDWMLGVCSGEAVSTEGWRRTLRACGCQDEAVVQLARRTHRELAPDFIGPFDDVQELLAAVPDDLRLAVITNGASDTQREALERMGLADRFDAVIISGEHGVIKPDPAIFGAALDAVGVDAANAWHVGDSLAADVAGALAAGITAIWLNRSGAALPDGAPHPDHEIRSLSEIPALLGFGSTTTT